MRVRRERPQVYGKSGTVALSPERWISLFCSRPDPDGRRTTSCCKLETLLPGCATHATTTKLPLAAWSPGSSYSNSIRAEHRPKQGAAIQAPMSNLFTCAARGRRDYSAYVAFWAASADAEVSRSYVPSQTSQRLESSRHRRGESKRDRERIYWSSPAAPAAPRLVYMLKIQSTCLGTTSSWRMYRWPAAGTRPTLPSESRRID